MLEVSTAHRFGDEVTIAFINTIITLHLGAVFASGIENMSSDGERQASRPRLAAMLVANVSPDQFSSK